MSEYCVILGYVRLYVAQEESPATVSGFLFVFIRYVFRYKDRRLRVATPVHISMQMNAQADAQRASKTISGGNVGVHG